MCELVTRSNFELGREMIAIGVEIVQRRKADRNDPQIQCLRRRMWVLSLERLHAPGP
jgi:hypothetical protein